MTTIAIANPTKAQIRDIKQTTQETARETQAKVTDTAKQTAEKIDKSTEVIVTSVPDAALASLETMFSLAVRIDRDVDSTIMHLDGSPVQRLIPDWDLKIKGALEGLWSSASVAGSEKSSDQIKFTCRACGIPEGVTVGDLAQNMIMIMLQDFMDPWTFNQKNLMKCCKEFLLPGGKQVPFCAYNSVGYREQARAQLDAQEPERRRARAEGRKYEPRAVTFDFSGNGKRPVQVVISKTTETK